MEEELQKFDMMFVIGDDPISGTKSSESPSARYRRPVYPILGKDGFRQYFPVEMGLPKNRYLPVSVLEVTNKGLFKMYLEAISKKGAAREFLASDSVELTPGREYRDFINFALRRPEVLESCGLIRTAFIDPRADLDRHTVYARLRHNEVLVTVRALTGWDQEFDEKFILIGEDTLDREPRDPNLTGDARPIEELETLSPQGPYREMFWVMVPVMRDGKYRPGLAPVLDGDCSFPKSFLLGEPESSGKIYFRWIGQVHGGYAPFVLSEQMGFGLLKGTASTMLRAAVARSARALHEFEEALAAGTDPKEALGIFFGLHAVHAVDLQHTDSLHAKYGKD